MPLPQPLRKLKVTKKHLLLGGGAFGIVALVVWFGLSYRIIGDHLADQMFRNADVGLYLEGRWPQELVEKLPVPIKDAIEMSFIGGTDDTVVYSGLDENGKRWWMSYQAHTHGWKIVPRHSNGYGYIKVAGRRLPIELYLGKFWFSARVGQGFRGFDVTANQTSSRLIKTIPEGAYLYTFDRLGNDSRPEPDSPMVSGLSGSWTGLYANLGHQIETILAHNEVSGGVQPFVIASLFQNKLRTSVIDAKISQIIGEAWPSSVTVELPDKTSATELKSDPSQTTIQRRNNDLGTFSHYGTAQKSDILTSFEGKNGQYWLSDNPVAIQGLLLSQGDDSLSLPSACAPKRPYFQAIYYTDRDSSENSQVGWISAFSGSLKKTVFSLNEAETGLFTLCGYFL